MSERSRRLVWVDLEMTGLDPSSCEIVEIATVITDEQLEVVAEGPELVIRPSDAALASMDPFVRTMHEKSGLLARIESTTTSLREAEEATSAFLSEHLEPKQSPLCGNSIWKDKQFLERYMPGVMALLHYRIVDVSTIKELVRRWYPAGYATIGKGERHRALDDVRESIAELRLYRERVFKPAS
jgi:oligoribonuclease